MAEAEEPQFTTLAERIAALNKQKNFKEPPPTAGKRPPPPPPGPARTVTAPVVTIAPTAITPTNQSTPKLPSVPPRPTRTVTDNAPPALPRRATEEVPGRRTMAPPPPAPVRGAPPPLPSRASQKLTVQAPKLPTRRPSGQDLRGRRGSNSSDASYISTMSNLSLNGTSDPSASGRRLPPTLDQAKLPPLPPTRRDREAAEAAATSPSLPPRASRMTEPPVMPPRLPSRPTQSPSLGHAEGPSPSLPARRLPPPPSAYRPTTSALQNGFNPRSKPANDDAPPPIPLNSRPTRDQIDAVASRVAVSRPSPSVPASQSDCLACRDFSAPDHVAAQYPISSLPRHDTVGYLAHVLCDPFPSLTDKARAIFTWCHHNIAYDVAAFFGGNVRHVTPEDAILSGKAVCAGYAGAYEAIALRAGLECLVVGGHGKGFGYLPRKPGEPVPPPDITGHAWNAVRIDGGRWKLIDACWGAGAVDNQQYVKGFTPAMFTLANDFFGLKHLPEDPAHQFREDGRRLTWEEYYNSPCEGEPAGFCEHGSGEGLHEFMFEPKQMRIPVQGGEEVVRFQFAKPCPHWTAERNGKGKQMLFVLLVHGAGGNKDDLLTLETDGFWSWIDVRRRELGRPGQHVRLVGLDQVGGQDARGMTREEWARKKGRVGYSWISIFTWELV
ncbi:hypothetical protein QBC39DRAFT_141006 [Podospora conica]|nr:hypothetical protein QBC39DRAFT_141006 [Schizothecium conicum]